VRYRSLVGQSPRVLPTEADPSAPAESPLSAEEFGKAFRQITPSLVLVGVATGAAFAIGSALASRYFLSPRRRR